MYTLSLAWYKKSVRSPGAMHMDAEDLEEASRLIPRDREIVLFCSCPNDATAAQMALRLRSLGITNIRPLAGGLHGWLGRGFPVQIVDAANDLDANAKRGATRLRDRRDNQWEATLET